MTAHAKLGASGAERWMTCPGSVVLEDTLPDFEGVHARAGSAAHALAEHCLLSGDAPFEYLNEANPDSQYADVAIDVDMVNAVEVYVDHCRSILPHPQKQNVELRVSLEKLGEWAEGMFGTADFIAVKGDTLYVRDYKHGMGVVVDADGNKQFMYYGLGALLGLHLPENIKAVNTGVVQPRAPHSEGPIRTATYLADDLRYWGETTLKEAVQDVRQAQADYEKGDFARWADLHLTPSEKGCKFCKAKGTCPALAKQAMETAMLEFEGDAVQPLKPLNQLSADDIARILENEKAIKDWLAGVALLAQQMLERGSDITGGRYKLVAGRSSRKWQSEDVAATRLASLGFEDDDIYSRKLVTPAQAEKLVGKEQRKLLAELVVKEEGKATLARADDKRPGIDAGPEADFME